MSSTLKTPASGDGGRQYVGFEEYIEYQLRVARKGIHGADLLSGIVGALLLVAGYLFLFAVTDHWVVRGGWGTGARYVWWGLFLAGVGYWTWSRIFRPWSQRVTQLYAASQLEQAHPELKSNLLTLIDLQNAGRPVSPVIIEAMERRAATNLQQVNVDDAVDRRPLTQLSYALLAMVVVLCIYTLASPKSLMSSAWRALFPMSNVAAGTRTTILEVLPGDTTLLSHSKPEITTVLSGAIPEEVRLVFSTADRKIVDEVVKLQDTEEGIHRFRGRLIGEGGAGLLQNVTYRVEAGDAVSPTYSITVRQPPTATVNEVVYDYPTYMGIDDRTQADSAIDAWEGTTVTIKAQANVPIDSANIQFFDTDDTTQRGVELPMQVQDGVNLTFTQQLKFRPDGTFPRFYRIEPVRGAERGIGMTLHTQRIRPDLSPKIEVLYPQGDLELPANATLPVAYEASDPDFMLKSVVMKFEKDGELLPRQEILFDSPPLAPKTKGKHSLAMQPFGLEPGQTLVLWLEAKDNFEPFADRVSNLTRSPKITITITAPIDPQAAADQQERQEQAANQQLEQSDPMENPAEPNGQPQEPMPGNTDQPPMPDQPKQDDPMAEGQPPMPQQEGQPQEPMPNQGEPEGDPQQGQKQGADGQDGQRQGQPQNGQKQKTGGQKGTPSGQPQTGQDQTGDPQSGQPQPNGGGQKTGNSAKSQPQTGQPQSNSSDGDSGTSDSGTNEPNEGDQPQKPEPSSKTERKNGNKPQPPKEKAAPDDLIRRIQERNKPSDSNPESNSEEKTGTEKTGTEKTGTEKTGTEKTGTEKNGTEKNGTEKNGTEKNGTEKNSTEKTGTEKNDPAGPNEVPMPNKSTDPMPGESDSGTGKPNVDGTDPMAPGKKPGTEQEPGLPAPMNDPSQPSEPGAEPMPGQEPKTPGAEKSNPAEGPQKNSRPQNQAPKKPGEQASEKMPANEPGTGEKQPAGQQPSEKQPGKMPGENSQEPGEPGENSTAGNQPSQKNPSSGGKSPANQQQPKGPGKSSDSPMNQTKNGEDSSSDPSAGGKQPGKEPGQGESGTGEPSSSGDMPSESGMPRDGESNSQSGDKPGKSKSGSGKSSQAGESGKSSQSGEGGKQSQSGEGGESSESGEGGESSKNGSEGTGKKPAGKKPAQGQSPAGQNPAGEEPMPENSGTPPEDGGQGGQGGGSKPEGAEGTPAEDPMAEPSPEGQPPSNPQNKPGANKTGGNKPGENKSQGQNPGQSGKGQSGQGQSGGKPGGDGPPMQGEGGTQSGSGGTASGHAPGSDAAGPDSDSGPVSQTPEEIDLENRKKAIGLQIKQLQDELSRGEVPEDLKDTGYSVEELEAFLRQLDQQVHNPDSSSPEAQARQRQFEELLKGVDQTTQGELKSGGTGERDASQSTGSNRLPTPKRYQSSEEAFRKRMQKAQ
jgi:hypothetical protein